MLTQAWDHSRARRVAAALVVGSSWLVHCDRWLRRTEEALERLGAMAEARGWLAGPLMSAAWVTIAILTTVATRTLIVWRFGSVGGRWWVPPGLVVMWMMLAGLAVAHRHPVAWSRSRWRQLWPDARR
jgi:hypothetical protein